MGSVRRGGRAALEAVLLLVIIGKYKINIRPECVLRAAPGDLENLVGGEIGVVNNPDGIAALEEIARRQRSNWVGELHTLIADKKLSLPDVILGEKHGGRVVGDSRRHKSGPLVHTQ